MPNNPREGRTRDHLLRDIIFITISACCAGQIHNYDIEEFGHSKEEWLRNHLRLANGIPAHGMFSTIFAALMLLSTKTEAGNGLATQHKTSISSTV